MGRKGIRRRAVAVFLPKLRKGIRTTTDSVLERREVNGADAGTSGKIAVDGAFD